MNETSAKGFETLSLWVSGVLGKEGLLLARCEDSLGVQVLVQIDLSDGRLPNRSVMDLLAEIIAVFVGHV